MRHAKPWYWKSRGCWYVQILKKQVRLDPDKDKALAIYHRLMADDGKMDAVTVSRLTIPEALDLWIGCPQIRRGERTLANYSYAFSALAKATRGRLLGSLSERDITSWLDGGVPLKPGTKHSRFALAKAFSTWCHTSGYTNRDILAASANPYGKSLRTTVMSREQFDRFMRDADEPDVRLAIECIYMSGCRTGEACKLQAKHLHASKPYASLTAAEHKTGKKTGMSRRIVFPEELMGRLRERVAGKGPDAFVLLSQKGRPWSPIYLAHRVKVVLRRIGMPEDLVPYSARHSFATEGIRRGESTAILAQAMGHRGDATIQAHYLHASASDVSAIVERRAAPTTKKADKASAVEEMKALSARLAELASQVLERNDGSGTTSAT